LSAARSEKSWFAFGNAYQSENLMREYRIMGKKNLACRSTCIAALPAMAFLVPLVSPLLVASVLHASEPWCVVDMSVPYCDTWASGVRQQSDQDPIRHAIAREVSRHLPMVGLPGARDDGPCSGCDARGRRWQRDACGYAYYEQMGCGGVPHRIYYQPELHSAAQWVRRQLDCVDWEQAVRHGVKQAVIRGWNAAGEGCDIDEATVRSAVRDQIVEGINRAAAGHGDADLQRFQQLVAEGVEDAIVEAFNQLDVVGGDAWQIFELESNLVSPDQISAATRAHDGSSPSHSQNGLGLISPAQQQQQPVVSEHYGGPLTVGDFNRRYVEAVLVNSGWVTGPAGLQPLVNGDFLILRSRAEPQEVEVWQRHHLLFEDCRYEKFYEDAKLAVNDRKIER
jgi:hypothetical protein